MSDKEQTGQKTATQEQPKKYTIELSEATYYRLYGFTVLMQYQSEEAALNWLLDRVREVVLSQALPAQQQMRNHVLPEVPGAVRATQGEVPFNWAEGEESYPTNVMEYPFKHG